MIAEPDCKKMRSEEILSSLSKVAGTVDMSGSGSIMFAGKGSRS